MLPLLKPYIEEGEIASLPSYNFYMRVAAPKIEEPVSGETILLPNKDDEGKVSLIISSSRRSNTADGHTRKREQVATTSATRNKLSSKKDHAKVRRPGDSI